MAGPCWLGEGMFCLQPRGREPWSSTRPGAALSALQVFTDHLRALNDTLTELQGRQEPLELAMRERREHLLALLQEPGCQGDCPRALEQAHTLELGADFSQVQAHKRGLFAVGAWKGCPRHSLWPRSAWAPVPHLGVPLPLRMDVLGMGQDLFLNHMNFLHSCYHPG